MKTARDVNEDNSSKLRNQLNVQLDSKFTLP